MKCLSSESLSETMLTCYKNPRYNALIYFISSRAKMEFLNELIRLYRNNQLQGVTSISTRNLICRIYFDNGSSIDMITVQNFELTVNEHRYHEILLDEDIYRSASIGMFSTITSSTTIPYRTNTKYYEIEEIDKNDELDNYLNSFKIVK